MNCEVRCNFIMKKHARASHGDILSKLRKFSFSSLFKQAGHVSEAAATAGNGPLAHSANSPARDHDVPRVANIAVW